MIREWLGDQPVLKAIAFALLLPLAGVNVYLITAGVAALIDPTTFLRGLAIIPLFFGAVGLLVQLLLMNAARHNPGTAGTIILIIAFVLFLPGAGLGLLGFTLGRLFLVSPLPGAVLLVLAAWQQAREATREATAWRSQPPSWH